MALFSDEQVQHVREHSYKDFHVKGFDYICLKRSPEFTCKVYFFNGDVSKLPEVVNPHDHRYQFQTRVLAGSMMDYRFVKDPGGDVYQAFDYMTPLNGGDGFTYRGDERLLRIQGHALSGGAMLQTEHRDLHTIRMLEEGTVIMLAQFADQVPVDMPTSTFVRKGNPKPDTAGLYSRFTEDEVVTRLNQIHDLLGRYGQLYGDAA